MLCSDRDELNSAPCRAERWSLGSIVGLGALFGLTLSPCSRAPLASAFVVVGVPLCTFLVAAPSRLGFFSELRLFARDAQAGFLALLCALTGRRQAAAAVVAVHRERVEDRYADHLVVPADALRLHHARRVGALGAALAVIAGVSLPMIQSTVFTYGDFPVAPFVFLTDLIVIGVTARVVAERMALRLFEATTALGTPGSPPAGGRTMALTAVLGCALGAVGSLVIVAAAAAASGVESVALRNDSFLSAAFWFMRETASMALPLGLGIGAIVGVGVGATNRR
jgi:hypothetical protein